MSRNYISHYGVPGMKWRFTKYTNKIRKGGKDVYEYFTKKTYGKSKGKLGAAPGIGSVSSLGKGRTQFERDFRKATKPIRKSWKKYYKNTLSPAIRKFKTAAPIKLQKLQYRLGGLKGKLISRLKGYTGGGGPSNIRSLDARTVKNARMTDHTKALTNKLYANSRSLNEVTEKRTLNGETLYKHGYRANKYNPYWGTNGSYNHNNKKRKTSQSDYSKHYKYKRNKGATNPYWGRK